MKRILSIVISMLMLISTAVVPAFAAGTAEVSVEVSFYDINVTAESTVGGKMTAQLVNKEENMLYGMYTSKAPVQNGDAYTYSFRFEMPADAPTGEYVVYVGHNVTTVSKSFTYVKMEDKVVFYDTLDAKAVNEIKAFFNDEGTGNDGGINFKQLVPVDLTLYNTLTDSVLSNVNAKIAETEVATGVTEADDSASKKTKIETAENNFKTVFASVMEIAEVATVTDTNDWSGIAAGKIADSKFDGKFYNAELTDTIAFELSDVLPYYITERSKVTEFTIDSYAKAFDAATLHMIAATSDYSTGEAAFLYYCQTKGSISADLTNISAIINAGKSATLWKNVSDKGPYADCQAFVSAAVTEAKALVDNGILSGTSTSTGGSVLKPSTPSTTGSLGGGGSSAVITPVTPSATGTFADVEKTHWAYEAIEELAAEGVLNGKGDGTFAPDSGVTREEFVKIIVLAFGLSADGENTFADVAADRWSADYIATAAALGIVNGDGESFRPAASITRQEMAAIIYRVAEMLEAELSGDAMTFDDAEEIADYARDAIDALTGAGIINGMGDGTFAPKASVTRAQSAKIVYELLNILGGGK